MRLRWCLTSVHASTTSACTYLRYKYGEFVAPSGGRTRPGERCQKRSLAAVGSLAFSSFRSFGGGGAHYASTEQRTKLVNSAGTEALEGRLYALDVAGGVMTAGLLGIGWWVFLGRISSLFRKRPKTTIVIRWMA
jgi:hypothetical protein